MKSAGDQETVSTLGRIGLIRLSWMALKTRIIELGWNWVVLSSWSCPENSTAWISFSKSRNGKTCGVSCWCFWPVNVMQCLVRGAAEFSAGIHQWLWLFLLRQSKIWVRADVQKGCWADWGQESWSHCRQLVWWSKWRLREATVAVHKYIKGWTPQRTVLSAGQVDKTSCK